MKEIAELEKAEAEKTKEKPMEKTKKLNNGPGLSKTDLEKLPKDDLLKMAKDLGIPEKKAKKKSKKKDDLTKLLAEASKKKNIFWER